MSVRRVEQIIAYGESMHHCYEVVLSSQERQALHDWEDSDEFTRTDFWPGWVRHIGPSPCAPKPHLELVSRRLA